MSSDQPENLPDEGDQQQKPESPWKLPQQEPTTLIALWPGDSAPTMTEVATAMATYLGEELHVEGELESEDPDVLWNMVVRLAEQESPIVVWGEASRPLQPGELGDPKLEACKWIIGAETMLDSDDPLTSYINVMRLIAGSLPDVPAVLDINATRVHERLSLDESFLTEGIEPSAEVLWIIHAVSRDEEAKAGTIWLHTHGLWRCGCPELEMLEVPAEHANIAAQLLNATAELSLEAELPPPGERAEVGSGLNVVFMPWQTVASGLDPQAPGSLKDRKDDGENPHTGIRAVICDRDESGQASCTWPKTIVERLEGDAAIYRTSRATERQAKLARATWPQLAIAFSTLPENHHGARHNGDPSAVFFLKAGFESELAEDSGKEHLWFQVRRFEGDKAEAELINQPTMTQQLRQGETTMLTRQMISDWSVFTPGGSFGPSEAAAMQRAVDALAHPEDHSTASPN